MFLHGRHETCYKAGGDGLTNEWPCRRGWRPVPSHAGYRYAADVLASHGHVVISVAANGVNAFDYAAADAGAKMRGRLVLTHLRTWRRWNRDTGGPFGSRFVRRLDLGNVGLMGHSRGGEGVVQAALLNHQLGDPFGIRAVMPLAPTNFQRLTLPGMPLAVVLPYCDGDVQDLQGQRFYDDARLSTGGRQPSLAVLTVMGANHNFFNTEWTPGFAAAPAMDDWAGFSAGIYRDGPDGGGGGQNRSNKVCNPAQPRRLTAGEQQAAGAAYIAGFFRLHLGREVALLGLLDGSGQRARSAGRAKVHVVAQSPRRRDLDRFSDPGRRRTVKGLHARICSGRSHAFGLMERLPACDDDLVGTQVPHWDESMNAPATPGVRMLEVSWSRPGGRVHVPLGRAQRDLSSMHAVTFRAAADPDGVPADMLVRLVDGSGRRRAVRVSDHSTALNPAPGNRPPLPHALPRQVHIPLSRFKGINLRRVASVTFVAASDQGRIWLADLAAQRPAIGAASLPAMPTLSIDNVRMKEGDLRPRLARFTVTASERARRPIRFHLQANRMFGDGSEGTELLPTRHRTWLTIPAGSRRAVFDYPVKANTVDDDDLLLTVTMTRTRNASLRRQSGRGLIADDDPTPTLTLEDGVAAESDGQLRFRMTLSEPSGRPVYTYLLVESGTAVAGEDFADVFAVDGEVRPGRTRGWITLPLIDDDVPEDTEDMYLRQGLYEIAGAGTVELTGTIHDDD